MIQMYHKKKLLWRNSILPFHFLKKLLVFVKTFSSESNSFTMYNKNKCGVTPATQCEQLCVVLKLYADGYVMLQ